MAKKAQPFILHRSSTNKVLGGVCGGLAESFNVDSTLIRILFLVAFIFGGSGLFVYLVMWLVMPLSTKLETPSNDVIRENFEEMKDRAQDFSDQFKNRGSERSNKILLGIVVVTIGLIFLLDNFGFGSFVNFGRLWPLLIIAGGFFILTKKDGK